MNNNKSNFLDNIINWIRKRPVLKQVLLFFRWFFTSTVIRTLFDLSAAVLTSFFTFITITENNKTKTVFNWNFAIPFFCFFLLYLIICHICSKSKDKALRFTNLYKQINEKTLEISVIQNSQFRDYSSGIGTTTPLDIVAQNVCQAVHDIICEFFSLPSLKVTVIKRCTDQSAIQMCGFYGKNERVPGLYKKVIHLNRKKEKLLCVSMFKDNYDYPLILRDQDEVNKEFSKQNNQKINTKQFLALPGNIDNQTVVLLQIASKKADSFNEKAFDIISNVITPTFLQILCNTYQTETHILNKERRNSYDYDN